MNSIISNWAPTTSSLSSRTMSRRQPPSTIMPRVCLDPKAYRRLVHVRRSRGDSCLVFLTETDECCWVHKSTLYRSDDWDDGCHGLFQILCFPQGLHKHVYVAVTLVPGPSCPPGETVNACFVLDQEPGPKQLKPFQEALNQYGEAYNLVQGEIFVDDRDHTWYQTAGRNIDASSRQHLSDEALQFLLSRTDGKQTVAFPLPNEPDDVDDDNDVDYVEEKSDSEDSDTDVGALESPVSEESTDVEAFESPISEASTEVVLDAEVAREDCKTPNRESSPVVGVVRMLSRRNSLVDRRFSCQAPDAPRVDGSATQQSDEESISSSESRKRGRDFDDEDGGDSLSRVSQRPRVAERAPPGDAGASHVDVVVEHIIYVRAQLLISLHQLQEVQARERAAEEYVASLRVGPRP